MNEWMDVRLLTKLKGDALNTQMAGLKEGSRLFSLVLRTVDTNQCVVGIAPAHVLCMSITDLCCRQT